MADQSDGSSNLAVDGEDVVPRESRHARGGWSSEGKLAANKVERIDNIETFSTVQWDNSSK